MYFVRLALAAVGAAAFGVALPHRAFGQKGAPNPVEVVIGNGPHAGTYKLPGSEVICMHVKGKQTAAAYKNFDPRNPKLVSEVGINVDNSDDAGAKRGEVRVAFGDPDKKPTVYEVRIPSESPGPLVMTKTGAKVDLSFQGKTKDGIQLRITARCADIEQF